MDTNELEQQELEQQELERQREEQLEEERRQRRRQRIEEMKREKRRREIMFRYGVPAAAFVFGLLLALGISISVHFRGNGEEAEPENSTAIAAQTKDSIDASEGQGMVAYTVTSPVEPVGEVLQDAPTPVFEAHTTVSTNGFSDAVVSDYGIIIDVEKGEVLAQKGGWSRINPASMTKILTILVAAEHVTDLEDIFTMTIDITDYSFQHGCSNTGFEIGEEIPIIDLFYGTALSSGADAALGLAYYVAGSHEAFVDMMNERLAELGLSETTHFTNCIGLYDENHYSTPYDMAVILKAAADNEFCREVLSKHHYVTTPTANHPEGIDISNWFLRRIEDRDTHGEVLCAKTGYVVQSRNCAASLGVDHDGREYVCVTAGSSSVWTCIKDQVELYQQYLPE